MGLTRINNQALPTLENNKLPSGTVLQVQQTKSSSALSSNATTFGDFLTVSITPTSTNSKILVTANLCVGTKWWNNQGRFRIVRDSTTISANSTVGWPWQFGADDGNDGYEMINYHLQLLDSPSTTSEITYKAQMHSQSSSYYVHMNRHNQSSTAHGESYITVMEIAG